MIIAREVTINKNINDVWEVLGNQFGDINNWSSLISKADLSGKGNLPGLDYSIRTTDTTQGQAQQEMTGFNPEQHNLSYKAISGTPFFIKSTNAKWALKQLSESKTKLDLSVDVQTKGLAGIILTPVAKKKLGKLGNELIEDFKYYVENGKPHPRKVEAMK